MQIPPYNIIVIGLGFGYIRSNQVIVIPDNATKFHAQINRYRQTLSFLSFSFSFKFNFYLRFPFNFGGTKTLVSGKTDKIIGIVKGKENQVKNP